MYVDNHEVLSSIIAEKGIKKSETAKVAIVRPTTHFAILTADNPDMVRTLELEELFVKEELEKLPEPLAAEEMEKLTLDLKKQFQSRLASRAYDEQMFLIQSLKEHNISTFDLVEDKGSMETSQYDYYTDQIFATDTGQYFDHKGELTFIPSNFKNKQRFDEERLAIAQAENIGANICSLLSKSGQPLKFEGGDIRQMPGKKLFFIGQGHRSDPETSQAIAGQSGYYVLPIRLLQKQFYHLDCCFLPLPNDAAVIYEGDYMQDERGNTILDEQGWPSLISGTETMDPESRALIRTIYRPEQLVLISRSEALAFATNAAILENGEGRFKMFVNGDRSEVISDEKVALQNHKISYTNEHIEDILRVTDHQMDIVEVPYSTIHESGGSVRCTIQEVACTSDALTPKNRKPFHFSEQAERLESSLLFFQTPKAEDEPGSSVRTEFGI